MLLKYFLKDFEMVPVARIISGVTFVFTFHMHCMSVIRSLYFTIVSAFFFSHSCPPGLLPQLAYIFVLHYPGLWCPVCCWGCFCRFALVDSIIWCPSPFDLFLLTLVHVLTRVHCLILPLFLYIHWSLLLLLLLLLLFISCLQTQNKQTFT
jgi:hypothetical protein